MFIRLIKSFLVYVVFWNPEHRPYAVELLKNGNSLRSNSKIIENPF